MSLPAADDLFRPTAAPDPEEPAAAPRPAADEAAEAAEATEAEKPARRAARSRSTGPARPSGRVRHDEKMTVYVTSEELLALEQARLVLRSAHGLGIDRGRLVREAIGLVLADFEANGDESALVRRLVEE